MCIKIEADATSLATSITNVEFFLDRTNSIGVATSSPFAQVWNGMITNPIYDGFSLLTTVATDTAGISATSAPVTMVSVLRPPYSVLDIISPKNGAMFATTDTIELAAELLASATCDTGPEEFFVGTNSVGIVNTNGANEIFTAATPLISTTVSNLVEGDYNLSVRKLGLNGAYCSCGTVAVRVVKLGLASQTFQPGGRFTSQVVTSFAGRPHVFEVSSNLSSWSAISTNSPSVSSFTFTDPSTPTDSPRFYRVSVPSP